MSANKSTKRWLFIAWAPYSRRSETFAQAFGAVVYLIHYLKFQTPLYAPLKYILQSGRTWLVLWRERPTVVFVQNPPFVAGLVVHLYCRLTGSQYVLDHHTAAFASTWKWAEPIQQFLARRAAVNIVTNLHWAEIIHSWQARPLVMKDPFVPLPECEPLEVEPNFFNLIVINTFAPDEPLDAVLTAAAQLPSVKFYITGNTKRKPATFFANLPANVVFTGFLPDNQYLGLFRAVDAALALTTRNYTLQRGGCEAVSFGKPLLTSDWPFLREFFARGTVYVTNTPDGIREGITTLQARHRQLGGEMVAFRDERRQEWGAQFAQLRQFLPGAE